jgi:hypothetical protein
MEYTARVTKDGAMDFGQRNHGYFKQWLKDNPGAVIKITNVLPESDKQRAFFEGAVVPLVAWYQQGMDYRSSDDLRQVREWLKLEFNADVVWIKGQRYKVGKSTKGREVLGPFLERVVEWLMENYDPPAEAIDPEQFKWWRDTIFPTGECDHYLEYLNAKGVLKHPNN